MQYTLNFSLKLERENANIIYDHENLDGQPIQISVPEITELLQKYFKNLGFEEVGIVERDSNKNTQLHKKKQADKEITQDEKSNHEKITSASPMKALSSKAFICKCRDIDKTALNEFYDELISYLQKSSSELSATNFLSPDICLSGMIEVINLRNYLARYVNSEKKNFQEGYLYVMSL
jgi:hypothetical protein